LTGPATAPAISRPTARLHQDSPSARPAAMAPGTTTMNGLSAISLGVIEAVSEA
jgi:hypothetical protein